MTRAKISRNRVKKAIPGSGGVIAIIARRTEYSWLGVRDFIRKDEELSRMLDEEAETINDLAETKLIERIQAGDDATARWWLSRMRRTKFGDNVDVTSGGEKMRFVVKWGDFADDDTGD